MKTYLVGGAVRDRLLGLPVRERDWVVVGATPDELKAHVIDELNVREVVSDDGTGAPIPTPSTLPWPLRDFPTRSTSFCAPPKLRP